MAPLQSQRSGQIAVELSPLILNLANNHTTEEIRLVVDRMMPKYRRRRSID